MLNPFADGLDASSGISPSIIYTHLVDVATDDGGATINGVLFDNTGIYSLGGPGNGFQNYNSPADDASGLEDLLEDFLFGGNPATLTLSGLVSGQTYKLRLYVGAFGGALQNFSFDDTLVPTVFNDVPRDAGDGSVPGSLDYTYTLGVGDTDLAVAITPQNPNDTFHFYGFSNEVVPEPGGTLLMALGGALLLRRRRK